MTKGIEGKIIFIVILVFLLVEPIYAATITGKVSVKLDSPKDVLVYIEKVEGGASPPGSPVKIDEKGQAFSPGILPVVKGATVEFNNSDSGSHGVLGVGDDAFSLDGEAKTHIFKRPGVVAISCVTHPEAEAYVVVLQNPHFALTDGDGKYAIKDVAPGDYRLKAWHNRLKSVSQEIQVAGAGAVTADFDLSTYAGTIVGTVSSKKLRAPKDVLIYIEKIEGQEFPPAEPIIMNQIKLVFIPRVIPVVVGTSVGFKNGDSVLHNVFGVGDDELNLGTWKGDEIRYYAFDKLGEVAILCDVHPEMEAYVVAVQNPYFSLTGKAGKYRIKDVAPGKYKLKTWNDRLRPITKEIEVPTEGGVIEVDFNIAK